LQRQYSQIIRDGKPRAAISEDCYFCVWAPR
jgi:hypothetical protein